MSTPDIRAMISANDRDGILKALTENPALANEGLPYDEKNQAKAHPLHRICDDVCSGRITDEDAIETAKIFLAHGADINGFSDPNQQDTPLIAAASLNAEATGIFYINQGADIYYTGTHGGTALHWAAWVGRDKILQRLLQEGAEINKLCIDFKGTPLLWAVHGYKFGKGMNRHHQVACVRLLLEAGADKTIPNIEGTLPIGFLSEHDTEMNALLS